MKRNPKSIPAFLLALVLAVSLVLPVGAAGSGITLDKTSATLAVGQTLTLTATLPEGSQDAAITWASANEAIAALVPPAQGQPANTAVFRGMTAGTVTVTATAGGRTALCTITVAQDTPASVTITPAGPEFLPVGKTRQLTAQVNYTLGSAGNQNVVWSSSDPQVATVDRNGKVTAVAEGTATILAVSEAKDALGLILVLDESQSIKAIYSFISQGVVEWEVSDLDATRSEPLIETFTITHKGLKNIPIPSLF